MREHFTEEELKQLAREMEIMAGASIEEMGKRQPGERQASEIYNEDNKD